MAHDWPSKKHWADLSSDGQYIMENLLPEWQAQFASKQRDYGGDANQLGIKGAYIDIHRKNGKLKRALWDDQKLAGEQPREILMDMIGHCFLTIALMDGGKPRPWDGEIAE